MEIKIVFSRIFDSRFEVGFKSVQSGNSYQVEGPTMPISALCHHPSNLFNQNISLSALQAVKS